jgi:hypothetical protein
MSKLTAWLRDRSDLARRVVDPSWKYSFRAIARELGEQQVETTKKTLVVDKPRPANDAELQEAQEIAAGWEHGAVQPFWQDSVEAEMLWLKTQLEAAKAVADLVVKSDGNCIWMISDSPLRKAARRYRAICGV